MSVTDTRCGISYQNIAKLFQKFIQVSTDSSRRKFGTRLGFFIIKKICRKKHRHIKAFSRLRIFSTKLKISFIDIALNGYEGLNKYKDSIEMNERSHAITMNL